MPRRRAGDAAAALARSRPAAIRLFGVRVHHLADLDLEIPLRKIVAVTGVSGSGKTSLAFDTVFAEAQRRFVDTFPARVRPLLPQFDRPAVDRIENLPAAIAVAQHLSFGPAATLASSTGLLDHLRALFAGWSVPWCETCGVAAIPTHPSTWGMELSKLPEGSTVLVAFEATCGEGDDGKRFPDDLRKEGLQRIEWEGRVRRLDEPDLVIPPGTTVRVLIDRITAGTAPPSRFIEALESAFGRGGAAACVCVDGRWTTRRLGRSCPCCGRGFPDPAPALFFLSSPRARCPACAPAPRRARKKPEPTETKCPECGGSKLSRLARSYRIGGLGLDQVLALAAEAARAWIAVEGDAIAEARVLVEPIGRMLEYLASVGLEYLSLDRPMGTLSSGEARRAALAAAFGAGLARTLYVLDEPTAGLHPRDTERLLGAIRALARAESTVLFVEHDRRAIESADVVFELGPGAGAAGGRLVFAGEPAELAGRDDSPTAQAWRRAGKLQRKRRAPTGRLHLEGASARHLQNLSLELPLGCLCVVAGVSGAGKSTLVFESLLPALEPAKWPRIDDAKAIGRERAGEVVRVDPAAVGRSSRGNPATYLKIFDEVRDLFADTVEARIRGLSARDFSFNTGEGRCPRCEGAGRLVVDLQFLPDVSVACPECGGKRFRQRVLDVKYRGKSVDEVLALTAREAFGFFRGRTAIQARLSSLLSLGLDYLELGQPLSTLSGGEAQRLLLASRLGPRGGGRALFLFDEPTIGLHPADIETLLEALAALLDVGGSIVAVEHDPQFIAAADHVVELGPGPGEAGGRIVAEGPPELLAERRTATGLALLPWLQK